MVAARINFQQGAKRNLKPMEEKEKQEYKGKNFSQNSSKGNSNNNKAKEKGVFKGKNKLTPKELECYRKENKCFKCGDQGHSYRSCPQRNPRNEQPRASMVEAPKEEVHCKGSPLSYAWGKVREHDAFILFDPGSTHNFISLELATKLGVQDFEMGNAMKADGAFINQEVYVTPLIGKLRFHIQGYVDKEDFFISPLKHEDVILGAPWFDRLAASIKFPEMKISFKFREKDMYINAQESGSSIPLVNDQAFDKSIKSSISAYMIFVKDSLNGVDETQQEIGEEEMTQMRSMKMAMAELLRPHRETIQSMEESDGAESGGDDIVEEMEVDEKFDVHDRETQRLEIAFGEKSKFAMGQGSKSAVGIDEKAHKGSGEQTLVTQAIKKTPFAKPASVKLDGVFLVQDAVQSLSNLNRFNCNQEAMILTLETQKAEEKCTDSLERKVSQLQRREDEVVKEKKSLYEELAWISADMHNWIVDMTRTTQE
ncbi:hypothetical protein L7F22_001319 [Adiantum nelumboides]|nr:hypothetical protein [Adiantum nelumboides]